MGSINPFTERGRITDPQRFAGRWRELALVFERLEVRRPVLIAGPPGIGKSSLLTHIAQAAGATLEQPDLESLYVDLAVLPDAPTFYQLVVTALHGMGDTAAALEVALLEAEGPVLLCLDGAEVAIAAGWGELLLERLARIARSSPAARLGGSVVPGSGAVDLLLVVVIEGALPPLSEPFATLTLGGLAPSEVRLIAEAYLDDTGVTFTPFELRELTDLSAGHPAYVQRAAFHLFQAKLIPGYDWRTAYLTEARERPIPGAALPPGVFAGEQAATGPFSTYGDLGEGGLKPAQETFQAGSLVGLLLLLLVLVAALLALQLSGNWLLAGGVFLLGLALLALIERQLPRDR